MSARSTTFQVVDMGQVRVTVEVEDTLILYDYIIDVLDVLDAGKSVFEDRIIE